MAAPPGNRNASRQKPWEDALRKVVVQYEDKTKGIEQGQVLAHLAKKTLEWALEGDKEARAEIANRLDGKPLQSVEANVEHSGSVEHRGLPEIGGRVADLLAGRTGRDSETLLPH